MQYSEKVYYRKVYFSIPLPTMAAPRIAYIALIKGREKVCLVDSGVSYNFIDIEKLCAEAGVTVKDINLVINTHCHADHTGANRLLWETNPEIQFYCHPAGKKYLSNIELQFKERPLPGFHLLMSGPVPVACTLADGEKIDIGGELEIIYTPGHSEDSISVYIRDEGVLITGDAVPYEQDVPIYQDVETELNSISKLEQVQADSIISAFSGLQSVGKYQPFLKAKGYMAKIQNIVENAVGKDPEINPQQLAALVIAELGVDSPVLPFVVASVEAHRRTSK